MDRLSVEVKLCRGDCSLVVSSDKFASPFTLAVEQTCASVEHHIFGIFDISGIFGIFGIFGISGIFGCFVISTVCERLIGTVFQLPSPDAIYSRDEEKKSMCGYPALFGFARGPRALGSRG
jgi:hypothetical protein